MADASSDLFVLSQDRKTVHIMVWKRDAFMYEERDKLVFEHEITNITPADFNGDGRMDLLVMWAGNSGGGWWGNNGKMSTDMEIVMGHEGGLSKGERWKLPPATIAQPMLFDDDLNLAPALLGYAETQDGPKIKAWRNTGRAMRLFTPMLFPADQVCQVVHPPVGAHSSAFIDMDGDCAPDVVLHCGGAKANHRKMQVWLNRGEQGYILSNTWDLPVGSRSITYADMSEYGGDGLAKARWFAMCSAPPRVSAGVEGTRENVLRGLWCIEREQAGAEQPVLVVRTVARVVQAVYHHVHIHSPMLKRIEAELTADRNGAMDLVFATCSKGLISSGLGEKCKIHVAYNKQAGLCSTKSSQYASGGRLICRGYEELCSADPHFDFQFWENSPVRSVRARADGRITPQSLSRSSSPGSS